MGRNKNTHPIDKLCREIINRYPESHEIAELFFRGQKILPGVCPDWCVLPSALMAVCVADSKDVQSILNAGKKEEVYQLASALIWSRNKMIYQFDVTLADTLAAQSLDGKIPTDILDYLPYPCVYIQRKTMILEKEVTGFFAWLDTVGDENTKTLRILFTQADGYAYSTRLPILGGTIHESILAVLNDGKKDGVENYSDDDVRKSPVTQTFTECVNLILYLCSEKPDMSDDTELKTRRSRDISGNPKRAATWEVGTRIGTALRKAKRAENEPEETESEETVTNKQSHGTPRPHLRRAHWHSFWTGKRGGSERKLVLRWLPPIAVNIDGAELPTVVTPVKNDKGGTTQ